MFSVLLKLVVVVAVLVLLRALVWLFNILVVLPLFDPLQTLPGPDGQFFQSHLNELTNANVSPDTHECWLREYGHTFRFHGFGKHDYRLLSLDLRVISHVLTSSKYEKPWQTRNFLARLIGNGIFSMEGPEHKMQRKLIGHAFSNQSVKQMTSVMYRKAKELQDTWSEIISKSSIPTTTTAVPKISRKNEATIIDVYHWISRASFDIIGLSGFDYHFHALGEESEPVYMAYRRMFEVANGGLKLRGLVDLYLPYLRKIWPGEDNTTIDRSLEVITQAGRKLITHKKTELVAEKLDAEEKNEKDLLSLLVKSNMSNDPSRRLTDQELLDQCSTFLLAGSDSVSTATSWALHLLSLAPSIQDRLRDELLSSSDVPADKRGSRDKTLPNFPTSPLWKDMRRASNIHFLNWELLDTLPYLDAIVRETLRLCPPVHGTIRAAMEDDQIPISRPVRLSDGTVLCQGDHIDIRKGSYIHIPIEALNYCQELWGSDAREFNPDRWFNLSPQARAPAHPGLGSLMTFSFGPHSCLGYKFTIAEMKVLLATLIASFTFVPAPEVEIHKHNSILTRPFVKDRIELGCQLPLMVQRIHQDDEH